MNDKTININVPVLARVEGEGALELAIEQGQITNVKLRIFEPPRFFEKFLEGRSYQDVPDTVARICGICPVAYQMSAEHALEAIFQTQITPWIRELRRVFYCGEWIQSHALHIHMLAAPDFLGCQSVVELAQKDEAAVRRGLRLQELGNDLMRLMGGRSVHPVGSKVGGFYHAPSEKQVSEMVTRLEAAWQESESLIQWLATLELPDDPQTFTCVAMRHADEYAMNEGHIVSDQGLDISTDEYQQHFTEHHAPHSTALHSLLDGEPYLVGPLARINLNLDRLSEEVLAPLKQTPYTFPSNNMYHSIIARAVEIRYAVGEALRVLKTYQLPECPFVEINPQAGTGYGCTEAPRGLLWHRYETNDQGEILSAIIIPPTSQNQARIEQDIALSLQNYGLDHSESELRFYAERVVRNYDPCISCATHFLELKITRDNPSQIDTPTTSLAQPLILAVGSPFGADNSAWLVAEQLQDQATITYSNQPSGELLPLLAESRPVLILDAMLSQHPVGSLHPLTLSQLKESDMLSSHGISLKSLLALADELTNRETPCQIIGISVGDGKTALTPQQVTRVADTLKAHLD